MTNEEQVPEVLSCPRKFLLIFLKNLCVFLGRKCQLACLIILSFAIPLMPVIIGQVVPIIGYDYNESFQPLLPYGIILCYSPQNAILELLVTGVSFSEVVSHENPVHVQGFVDAEALEEALTKNSSYKGAFGIEFPDEWSDISELPHRFRFALRIPVTKEGNFKINLQLLQNERGFYYIYSGFLFLQTELNLQYLQKKNSTHTVIRSKLESLYDKNINIPLSYYFGVFIMFAFLCPFTMDVKSIVEEKELQLKDMLNISDVSNSLQWLQRSLHTKLGHI